MLAEFGAVDDDTTVATTVHERQLVAADVALDAHDVPLDLLCTPERTLRPDRGPRPAGVDWDALAAEKLESIPALRRLREGQ